uniref:FIP-RBD domain-containing protein n=1 Tax=Panagrellus redivivus TaxID=6233 RepID=A0A7E4UMZ2_PANRE
MARIYESLNNDVDTPNGMRLTSSPTSASVASRLYANGGQRGSRRTSFSSEPDILCSDNEIHSEFSETSSHVHMLAKQLSDMQDSYLATNEEKSRLKTECAVLQERMHTLEEQQSEFERRWKEKLEEEKQRSKDALAQYDRQKQIETMTIDFQLKELQHKFELKTKEHELTKAEVTKLERVNAELSEQLDEALSNVEKLESERNNLKHDFEKYKLEAQNDIENSSELLEELTRQTDELRNKGQPRHGSLADQMIILEEEIEHLREENRTLQATNEELQSTMLHDSVARGRVLLQGGMSLADELNSMDSTELMNALQEQELDNQKLRQYINGILMRVIERHPEILEIKDEELEGNQPRAS